MLRRLAASLAALALAPPASAQSLPEGQGEVEYQAWLARGGPGRRAQVMSFELWQEVTGVRGVLPTWQVIRTASMWRRCNGEPFEVPPFQLWPGMVDTLRFIRDRVKPAVGDVEAVSGFRNPALNVCARGSDQSAHLDFFALDLIPKQPLTRRQLFDRLCPMHTRFGPAAGAGLGFYAFTRFHIDTRSFRRWGVAGPRANESPCDVLARGGDPEAPPLPPAIAPPTANPPSFQTRPPPAPTPPQAPSTPVPQQPQTLENPS